jgi:hypothetical protein
LAYDLPGKPGYAQQLPRRRELQRDLVALQQRVCKEVQFTAMVTQRKWMHQLSDCSFGFLLRVVRRFIGNQGLLLAGAVAYYTLLSIVPLSTWRWRCQAMRRP